MVWHLFPVHEYFLAQYFPIQFWLNTAVARMSLLFTWHYFLWLTHLEIRYLESNRDKELKCAIKQDNGEKGTYFLDTYLSSGINTTPHICINTCLLDKLACLVHLFFFKKKREFITNKLLIASKNFYSYLLTFIYA